MNKFVKLLSLTTLSLALMTTGIFAATPAKVPTSGKTTTTTVVTTKDSEMNINTSTDLMANKVTQTNNMLNTLKVKGVVQTKIYENPSTGYTWVFQVTGDQNVIAYTFEAPVLKDAPKSTNLTEPLICGAGLDKTLTIKGLKAGRATLKMKLVRSWEKNVAPIQTMEFEILVK